jgi:ABC-type transport system involved in multi-copper enzyme maturation permease subunit
VASWRLGPVFVYECVTAARRWQTYAGRAAFLAVLFVSLAVVWVAKCAGDPRAGNLSRLAQVGESFYYALAGTQLVLVLLAAPAYTAGAICLDKARGTLAHMLVTELSSAEIILGKLGSRLLPVLGMVFATLPILALATLLGGIDPGALFGSFLVTFGVAILSCALALALSVWGNKPYEVLLVAYGAWTVALLAWPAWYLLPASWTPGPTPAWLEKSNPFWLAFAPYLRTGGADLADYLIFLGACLGLSALLTMLAAATLRRSATRESGRRSRRRRGLVGWRLPRFGPSLDFNPVLWREWHRRRPSRWVRVIWVLYVLLSVGASGAVLGARNTTAGDGLGAFVNAFQYSIGLLLVSVTSVASLFEERVRGSLDVLLTTPLSTASIVRGKWWGAYRTALLVMILPLGLAGLLAVLPARPFAGLPPRERSPDELALLLLLLAGLMLAYGAAVTSLGLALATWVKRFGVAVGLSVASYLLVTGGSVLVLLAVGGPGNEEGIAFISPWFGAGEMTYEIGSPFGGDRHVGWKIAWGIIYAIVAVVLAMATRRTFDRCLGRMSEQPFRRPPRPVRRRVQR